MKPEILVNLIISLKLILIIRFLLICNSDLPLNHPDESGPVARLLLHPILRIIAQHNREVKTLGFKVDNLCIKVNI